MILRIFAAWLILCSAAFGQVGQIPSWPPIQVNGISGYAGPGDVVSGATAWWGLRGYNAAYATGSNPAAVVCDTATFSTCSTINILSNGKFDTATASGSAACASSCVIQKFTDQTGNGHDATCASAAVCATLTFNCINTNLPCFASVKASNTAYTIGGSAVTVTTGFTFSAAFKQTTLGAFGPMCCTPTANTEPQWGQSSTASTEFAANGTSQNITFSPAVFHSNTLVFNGASSVVVVDATANTGLSLGTTGGTITGLLRTNNLTNTASTLEIGLWGSTVFNATQYGNMCHNQFTYWATGVSC